ncbi:hypothetical protein B9Y64_19355 [Stenotrophomonas maltophilia]|uniref:Fimbrial-type adhesion domain-containing protein n=2 Tax=Lysobacteraceae TaxID=32033 RepID=A0A2J0U6X9_STEMA|nr:hypothetical protein B9Y64_19355 [Stenotrophomonas maltophilia]
MFRHWQQPHHLRKEGRCPSGCGAKSRCSSNSLNLTKESNTMKKITFALSAALAAIAASASAQAQDGTITFTGSVLAESCAINVNGGGAANGTVILPSVSTGGLNVAGLTLGATPFSIVIGTSDEDGQCDHDNVQLEFRNSGRVNAAGRLTNGTGEDDATNVEVAVLNGDREVIDLSNNTNSKTVAITDGVATIPMYAQYHSTGAATAGDVSTSVQYAVTYP